MSGVYMFIFTVVSGPPA